MRLHRKKPWCVTISLSHKHTLRPDCKECVVHCVNIRNNSRKYIRTYTGDPTNVQCCFFCTSVFTSSPSSIALIRGSVASQSVRTCLQIYRNVVGFKNRVSLVKDGSVSDFDGFILWQVSAYVQ